MNSSLENQARDSFLQEVFYRFGLIHPGNCSPDAKPLIFFGLRSFDTSFLLLVDMDDAGNRRGAYFELLPSYHSNINDVANTENEHVFFEGYSFILDSTQWDGIKLILNEFKHITSEDVMSKSVCRDCSTYGLYFQNFANMDFGLNARKFESLYAFFRKLFLNDLISSRVPKAFKYD